MRLMLADGDAMISEAVLLILRGDSRIFVPVNLG